MRAPVPNRYVRPMRDWDHLLDVVLARPGMDVGLPTFERVAAFVEGFGSAIDDGALERFGAWLARTVGEPQSPLELRDGAVVVTRGTQLHEALGIR